MGVIHVLTPQINSLSRTNGGREEKAPEAWARSAYISSGPQSLAYLPFTEEMEIGSYSGTYS